MLPRLVFVLGLTVGVMGPLIWAGYALLPAPRVVSGEGRIRTDLPAKTKFQITPNSPRAMPPKEKQTMGNSGASPLRSEEQSVGPSAPSSHEAETEGVIKPALPQPYSPNALQQRTPSANAISTEGLTPPASGTTTGSPPSTKTITVIIKDGTTPSSSAKSQGTRQDQHQEPMTADHDTVSTIPLSAEDKSEEPTRKSPDSKSSSHAKIPKDTGVYRQPKKKRVSLDGSVHTADKRLCGFGSYVVCTQGLCWQFCY